MPVPSEFEKVDCDERYGNRNGAGTAGSRPSRPAHGAGTRIYLDVLVADFKRGDSPEAVHDDHETVPLAGVYATLSYYLRHRVEVEEYLAEQEREGAEIRARIEANDPPEGLRAKLLARFGS